MTKLKLLDKLINLIDRHCRVAATRLPLDYDGLLSAVHNAPIFFYYDHQFYPWQRAIPS